MPYIVVLYEYGEISDDVCSSVKEKDLERMFTVQYTVASVQIFRFFT